ncbi:MAG: hypothetical protein ACFCD0_16580 [Gemmataceae bacterium]
MRVNVQLDVACMVSAQGCYRWLASRLKGYEKAHAEQQLDHFVQTSGQVEWSVDNRLRVTLDGRSHNPIQR